MNILKVIKNEFIKLVHQKKFLILIGVIFALCMLSVYLYSDMRSDIINNTGKVDKYSSECKALVRDMNYIKFSMLFSGDFVYKQLLPIYLIFIAIILTTVLSEDYIGGTMKFSLISPVTKTQLIIGKVFFIFIISIVIALFNLILSLIVGYIAFGDSNATINELVKVCVIYMSSVIPVTAFGTIMLFISLVVKNTGSVIRGSIIFAIILNITDYFTKTKMFSPIGILAKFSDTYYINIAECRLPLLISAVYIVVFSILIIVTIKNKDIVY